MAHHTRTKNVINIPKHSINYQPTFFVELTVEEQGMLLNIRKKKIEPIKLRMKINSGKK